MAIVTLLKAEHSADDGSRNQVGAKQAIEMADYVVAGSANATAGARQDIVSMLPMSENVSVVTLPAHE